MEIKESLEKHDCTCFYASGYILLALLTVFVINKQYLLNSAKNHLVDVNLKVYTLIVITFFMTIIILPLCLVLYLLFGVYKKIVEVILKFKYERKFGGFLENFDAAWGDELYSKAIINVFFLVKFEGEPDEFCEKVKRRLAERCFTDKHPKLKSTRHKYLGYTFLLRNDFCIDECLSQYQCDEEIVDQEVLEGIFSRISNEPLPKNHSAFWEMIIVNKPVQWTGNDKERKYFVMARMHHSLCDGIGTQKMIINCFADKKETIQNSNLDSKTKYAFEKRPCMSEQFLEKLVNAYRVFTSFCLSPTISVLMLLRRRDETYNTVQYSGEKICNWSIESEPKYVEKIKKIKRAISNITFSDVVMTAISASFTENILKDTKKTTNFVSTAITNTPYLTSYPNLHHTTEDTLELNNDAISAGLFWSPAFLPKTCTYADRLKILHEKYNLMKNSYDTEVTYWTFRITSVILPNYTSKIVTDLDTCPVIISNVPGLQSLNLFDGCRADEIVGAAPNYASTGFTVTLNTYQNRFQIILLADRGMVQDEKTSKRFLDGIYKHLDRLYEELLFTS